MRARWRIGLAALIALVTQIAPAQDLPPISTPPPAIAFTPWRIIDRQDDFTEYLTSFPSAVVTPHPENNVVPLRIFTPAVVTAPIPIVLITHYWGATDLRAERSLALDLNRRGIAAAVMTLPYHLTRAPQGTRSGALAIQPDPASLRTVMTQAVLDVRRSLDFLATQSEFRTDRIGIMGTSLGAIVAVDAYAVDSRITDAAFVLGGADLAHILWSSSRVAPQRDVLRRKGFTEGRLADALKPIEPLTYLPRSEPGDTFVVVARYDTVVPRRSSSELISALKDPQVLMLETGHYGGIFVQGRVLREVASFFAATLADKVYVAPKRLISPTIRLGAIASAPGGLDLGAGLDLFQSGDAFGRPFSTFFITPRGPQLFAGTRILPGLHLGVVGSFRRVGLGLLWSTVL